MTQAQTHDPDVDDPSGYQHRFAEVDGVRTPFVEKKGGAR
jgi:hypothetical protein